MVKTKIICTIGPASRDTSVLRKMMLAGMDVARINFSHGTYHTHNSTIRLIKGLNRKYRRSVKILHDLEGYRIRIRKLKDAKPIELKKKKVVLLTNRNIVGQGNIIPFDYEGALTDIKPSSHFFIDDGNICLLVKGKEGAYLKAEVIVAGLLKENKGVNIPDVELKFKGLTDKDKEGLEFSFKHKPDFIAQSFVRDENDIIAVRKFIRKRLPACKIIAKIENRQGIKNIDKIIKACDGIMVARGDMGVSLPIYEIPIIQKMIIKKCNAARKPVITATQMLESMTENIRPTRAEVTDVANAILDGTDFIMLSGETAAGKYPVEAVQMMNQIAKFTEQFKENKKLSL